MAILLRNQMDARKPYKELVYSLLLILVGALILWLDGPSAIGWVTVVFFGLCSIILLLVTVTGRRSGPRPLKPIVAAILPDAVEIRQYPFSHSTIYGRPATIPASRISCLFNSIGDVAFVLDQREVIFLPREMKESFAAFAEAHGIPDHKLEEAWMLLADPYIDQPYEEADEVRDDRRLADLGIPAEEVKRLRQRIGPTMLRATAITWEWGLYTTQDVLHTFAVLNPLRFTREFYWAVMEVALRAYPFRRDNSRDQYLQTDAEVSSS